MVSPFCSPVHHHLNTPLDPPPRVASYLGEKSHLGRAKSRRSPAEGEALMAESLARRDHPEEFNVWPRPCK
jgi:hypothetical protein